MAETDPTCGHCGQTLLACTTELAEDYARACDAVGIPCTARDTEAFIMAARG